MLKMRTAATPSEAIPTDPTVLYDQVKYLLFCIAGKVRQAIRCKSGSPRTEADAEELVNDSFACLLEALPRLDMKKGKLSAYVAKLAKRRMWLVARAAFHGVSPEELHRIHSNRRRPRHHHDINGTIGLYLHKPAEDGEVRRSVRWVAAIRRTLYPRDRELVDLYVRESGNITAVSRCLGRNAASLNKYYRRLFGRIKQSRRFAQRRPMED